MLVLLDNASLMNCRWEWHFWHLLYLQQGLWLLPDFTWNKTTASNETEQSVNITITGNCPWKVYHPPVNLTLSCPTSTFVDFTLSNATWFYSSMGNPLGRKGLKFWLNMCKIIENNCSMIHVPFAEIYAIVKTSQGLLIHLL